ncbi:MAG: sulfite exporter TauE/SafE family protein [Defluviitaleaceae bacterium]|nr:sulfite exporter TauE/SafE family protein [Defluviitaleaceae bacterium]
MSGYLLIGVAAGVISGLGIGGGTLLIPALVIFFAMGQQEAQNINLIYFIPTGIIAVATHLKQGNILKKEAVKLALWGLPAAVIGAFIAIRTDADLLRRGFGFFLLAMGAYELFGAKENRKKGTYMELTDFIEMKERFAQADTDSKIDMYIGAQGLTQTQYRELLTMFPLNELGRLEAALG